MFVFCVRQFSRQQPVRYPGCLPLAFAALMLFLPLVRSAPAVDLKSSGQFLQRLDSTSVSAFADQEIPKAMRAGKIPGAVFVVVQGNQVLCEKAYGVADLKNRQPVSASGTLFRVASISKILTAASALQLVQSHKLELHRDVNDYLSQFKIQHAFDAPITLFNLLTHSSGFDQSVFGYAAQTATDKLSLRNYLVQHEPARVRPPGLFSVYDNYGFALAGYLVQRAAGMTFADYVEHHLLTPLDMEHSSFSPGVKLRKHLATGYWLDADEPSPYLQHYINITPAAGFCTTASDMSDFLIALLANRRPDGEQMFPPELLEQLTTPQFIPRPGIPGRCFGFNDVLLAGRSALRQPGQWPGFNSVLLLFPKENCGLFLAYNLCDYEYMDHQISRRFAEAFIPPNGTVKNLPQAADTAVDDSLDSLFGYYLSLRSAHESPSLNFPGQIKVTRGLDGTIEINGAGYRELKPLIYEKIETNHLSANWLGQRLTFYRGADGKVTHLITQSGTYRRANWFESRRGRQFLLSMATAIFLSAILLWPVMFLFRSMVTRTTQKSAGLNISQIPKLSLAARGIAFVACILALWFEASLALAEWRLKPFADFFGLPATIQKLLWALPTLCGLTVMLVIFSVLIWRKRIWHPLHRVHYTLLIVGCVLFLYFFYSRHLLFYA